VRFRSWRAILVASVVAVSMSVVAPAHAATGNPGVVDPNGTVLGKSYAEWSAEWWKWVFDTPATASPFQSGHVDCDFNLPNPNVIFLAGPFNSSGTIDRTCRGSITTSTYVFFPVLNIECSTLEVGTIFFGGTPQDRRRCAKSFAFADMHASIASGGVTTTFTKLNNLAVTSPDFAFTAIDGNAGGVPPGDGFATSYGVWIMLQPLAAGTYTINFGGFFPDFAYTLDVTYHITVK
jgi:hypothetical protein